MGRPAPAAGAHGAFTWGVLDALLEDCRIGIDGICGISRQQCRGDERGRAGPRVAAGGPRRCAPGAGRLLGRGGPQLPAAMVSQGNSDANELSPASKLIAGWAGFFSPAQLNPFDLNPLRDLFAGLIDFERLRAASPFKLFVGATQVCGGRLRVLREQELTGRPAAGAARPAAARGHAAHGRGHRLAHPGARLRRQLHA